MTNAATLTNSTFINFSGSKHIHNAVFLLLLLSFLGSGSVIAGDNFITETDYLTEMPLVLSATRLQQARNKAPTSTTIIDQNMIKASAAIDIADLMRLVPGFQVSLANANVFAVTSHGVSYEFPRKLQVLIDGRSVYRPLLSNVDWSSLGISLADIDRIEIVRGPNAPVYGSNAFLGTINIITKQAFQENGTNIEHLSGSRQTNSSTISHSSSNNSSGYRITFQNRRDDGFKNINDERNINFINLKANYDPTNEDTFEFHTGYSYGELGAWGEKNSFFNPVRDKKVTSAFAHIRWTTHISNTEDFHLQLYHNYYEQNDLFQIGPLADAFNVSPAIINLFLQGRPDQVFTQGIYHGTAKRTDLEIQHTLSITDISRLVWGASLREDKIKSVIQLDHSDYETDLSHRLFIHSETMLNKTTINIGAMVETNDLSGTHLSPRIGINHELNPNNTIRTSIARAYRTPSLYESNNKWEIRLNEGALLKTFYDSSDNLMPEKITSYEIGLLSEYTKYRSNVDIKLFYEKINNFIVAPIDSSYIDSDFDLSLINQNQEARVWQNGGGSNTQGLELEIRHKPNHRSIVNFSYTYSQVKGEFLRKVSPDISQDISSHIPTHTISALYQRTFSNKITSSLVTYYMDQMEWEGKGTKVNSYFRVDARIAKSFRYKLMHGEISILSHNLFDELYKEFNNDNNFSRRSYIQLTLNI